MKKLALTFAIVLGLSMTTFADQGGLFQRGDERENNAVYGNRGGNGLKRETDGTSVFFTL